ncbi:MAG: hypothetical protein V9E90_04720 [Saprospiraceae bacterium]
MELQLIQDLLSTLMLPSRLDEIHLDEIQRSIFIKRDDLIHPVISGNKWRKLDGHIQEFIRSGSNRMVSMGGVHSNHLHALAYVSNFLKCSCDLLVYGWHDAILTPTLKDAMNSSANLHSLTRSEAQQIRNQGIGTISDKWTDAYWIPEGGGGDTGSIGMAKLVHEMPDDFDQEENLLLCPCGSGTSLFGLLEFTKHIQIVSLKNVVNASYPKLSNARLRWIQAIENKSFGKVTPENLRFVNNFKSSYHIELDLIYTAPLMQAFLNSDLAKNYKQIYFIHTGGLQGNRIHL